MGKYINITILRTYPIINANIPIRMISFNRILMKCSLCHVKKYHTYSFLNIPRKKGGQSKIAELRLKRAEKNIVRVSF